MPHGHGHEHGMGTKVSPQWMAARAAKDRPAGSPTAITAPPPRVHSADAGCSRARRGSHPAPFVRLLRLGGVRVSIPEALDAMRCASQPGVLADRGPTHRAAGRACQGQAGRTGLRRDLRRILLAGAGRRRGPRPWPWARSRGSHRHGRTRGVHDVRGAQRDPAAGPRARQASGYPAVFRSAEPRPAVQPAPGGEQNRPRGADGRDRVLKGDRHSGGESYRVQLETERLHGAGAPGTCQRPPTQASTPS